MPLGWTHIFYTQFSLYLACLPMEFGGATVSENGSRHFAVG